MSRNIRTSPNPGQRFSLLIIVLCLLGLGTFTVLRFRQAPVTPDKPTTPDTVSHNSGSGHDISTGTPPVNTATNSATNTKVTPGELLLPDIADATPKNQTPVATSKITSLFVAIKQDDATATALLLAKKPALVLARNDKGATPLILAASRGNLPIVKLLLAHKAQVDARVSGPTLQGQSALHLAAARGDLEIMRALLAAKANPNVTDSVKATPLHEAAIRGQVKAVALLLKHQAQIDARQNNGLTPLVLAITENKLPVVKLLIKSGANVNACDDAGMTPLTFAQALGKRDAIIVELTRCGAKE